MAINTGLPVDPWKDWRRIVRCATIDYDIVPENKCPCAVCGKPNGRRKYNICRACYEESLKEKKAKP
jgi:hypothetical protein